MPEENKPYSQVVGPDLSWADIVGKLSAQVSAINLLIDRPIDFHGNDAAGVSLFKNTLLVSRIGKFKTIQAAIDFANNDASATNPYLIVIDNGIYTENITLRSYVSLRGEGGKVIIQNSGVNDTVAFNGVVGIHLENIEFKLIGSLTSTKSLFHQSADGTNNIAAINCTFSIDIANANYTRYGFNLQSTTTLHLINPVFNVTTGRSGWQHARCIYVPEGKAVNLVLINPEWNFATGAYALAIFYSGTGTNHIINPILEHRHTNQAIFFRGGTTHISGGYLHSTSGHPLNLYNSEGSTCVVHLLGTNIKNDSGVAIKFLLYIGHPMSLYGYALNIEGSLYGIDFGSTGTLSGGEVVLSGTIKGATADVYRDAGESAITIKDAGVHLYNNTSTNITWTRTISGDTVDGFHASATATANYLLALNASKDLPMDGKITGLTVPTTAGDSIRATAKITETILEDQTDYNTDFTDRTGFPGSGLTTTVLSFVGSTTRTLTISSVGATFDYYIKGIKYTVTTSDSIQLTTDTEGKWYVWYDGSTLTTSQTMPSGFFKGSVAPVAIIQWDATNKVAVHIHRETHDISSQTHEELHYTAGCTYRTGLDISGYTLNTDSDVAVTFGISDGIIYDEDMKVSIVGDATPDADFEQILADPAQIPVNYLSGAGADIRADAATDYAFKNTASGRINYNQHTGGAWQQTQGTDNYFIPYLLCGANLIGVNNASVQSEPLFSVQGQAQYSKLADAIEAGFSAFDLTPYSIEELKPLYLLIFRSKDTFSGTRKAKLVSVQDFRKATVSPGGVLTSAVHNALSDRDATACHPATAIATDTTNFNGALGATELDVQLALDVLDDDVATNTTHSGGDGSDHTDVATNTTHSGGDGSDHADVASNTAHRDDNSQAHTDYLINNANDTTTGNITISKNDPTVTWTDVGDGNSAYATRSDTNGLYKIVNPVYRPAGSSVIYDVDADWIITDSNEIEGIDETSLRNYALGFSGSGNQYAYHATLLDTSYSQLTIAGQIYLDSAGTGVTQFLALKNNIIGTDRFWIVRTADDKILIQVEAQNGGLKTATCDSSVPTDQTIQFVCVYDAGSPLQVHINNVAQTAGETVTGTVQAGTAQDLAFGLNTGDNSGDWYGKIGTLSVYQGTAWGVSEVSAHYNSGRGTWITGSETGITAGWNFYENTGTTAHDETTNYDLTLVNTPTWVAGKVYPDTSPEVEGVEKDFGSIITVDFSAITATETGTGTVEYAYSLEDSSGSPSYSAWMDLATLQAITDATGRYVQAKWRLVSDASQDCGLSDLTIPQATLDVERKLISSQDSAVAGEGGILNLGDPNFPDHATRIFGTIKEDIIFDSSHTVTGLPAAVASGEALTYDYSVETHIREIPPATAIPYDGVTFGVSNCYWLNGLILFGQTAYQNSELRSSFRLPPDYVGGTNIAFTFCWILIPRPVGAFTIDTETILNLYRDEAGATVEDTVNQQFSGDGTLNHVETVTLDGTNLIAGDMITISLSLDETTDTHVTIVFMDSLQISVNERD